MPCSWSIKLLVLHYFEQDFFTTKGTTFKEQSATWSMVLRKTLINLCMNLTDEMQIKISMKLLVSTSNLQFFTALSRWVLHCFLLVTTSFINSVMHIFLQYFYHVLFTHQFTVLFCLKKWFSLTQASCIIGFSCTCTILSFLIKVLLTLLKSNSNDFTFFLVLT